MKHVDLFSGIGGFTLAAQTVWGDEHEIVCFVEQDEFCQKVLGKHWPGVPIHNDIKTFPNTDYGRIDLITGGFPCQDVSIANANPEGLSGERSGLWEELFRCIGIFRPKYAIIENVPALVIRGLIDIIRDLASIGYDAEWDCISASIVGAIHSRKRIWIVAYPSEIRSVDAVPTKSKSIFGKVQNKTVSTQGTLACDKRRFYQKIRSSEFIRKSNGIPNRLDRVGCLGNAIIPQAVRPIMQAIKELSTPGGTT